MTILCIYSASAGRGTGDGSSLSNESSPIFCRYMVEVLEARRAILFTSELGFTPIFE